MTNALSGLLTIALITHNEANNLAACLDSVASLNCPIVIIDSGSEDETLAIAARYGAHVYSYTDWQGFGIQRNRAAAHTQTPWVLWLDADERLDETTRQHLCEVLPHTAADGKTVFAINRLTHAYGGAIRHCGWYPDHVVRCYPIAHCAYGNELVHESVRVPPHAQTIKLRGDVLHYTYRDINHHLTKMMDYAHAWAMQQQGKKHTTPFSAFFRALFAFFRMYLLKLGFLDGAQGLIIAVMNAVYTFIKYTQLWQLQQKKT